jgi:iron complex outermembrane recepter protein
MAEVVVTGKRAQPGDTIGSPAPLFVLSPDDIAALGAATVDELLDAIKLEVKGAGDDPIYLVNGRRVSSFAVMKELPPEAILRIQVLPEAEALRYGYAANQRVVNLVLRDPYRGVTVDGAAEAATEGDAVLGKAAVGATDLAHERRLSLNLTLEEDSDLLAKDRDVIVPSQGPTNLDGEPAPSNLAAFETLRPWQQKGTISGVFGETLGSVAATVDASYTGDRTRSDQGLAFGTLTVPPNNPFARSGEAEVLSGYLPEAGPLQQSGHTSTGHFGVSLDAPLKNWTWSLTASEDHTQSATRSEIGIDLTQAQNLLNEGSPTLDPFVPLPPGLLQDSLLNQATSTLDDAALDLVLDGEVARLPAGRVSTTFRFGGNFTHESSQAISSGLDQAETLQRTQGRGEVVVVVPIADRKLGVLPSLGVLSADLDLGIDEVSDFGVLKSTTAGFAWSPTPSVNVHGAWSQHQDAPRPQDLDAPTVITPNVSTYDYQLNQTVLVTELSGGNPDLKADQITTTRLTLQYTPTPKAPLDLAADWAHTDSRDQVATLPVATAAVEAAFPDRFIRDSSGALVEIDARSVNFYQQIKDQLVLALELHATRPSRVSGGNPTRVFFAVSDTWTLDDTLVIRPGLTPIDLLRGGAVAFAGGQPVHVLNLNAGIVEAGMGLFLNGKYQSSTFVDNGSQVANLSYSALTTVNLRSYIDFGARPALSHKAWAHGLRFTLGVNNLFDSRNVVRNGLDQTPLAFQGPYLDPVGRFIHLELRKVF